MKKSPLQFSLAALLLTVAVLAGDLALMVHEESLPAMLVLLGLTLALMSFVAVGALYGRDNVQPFCVGAAFPLLLAFLFTANNAVWLEAHVAGYLGRDNQIEYFNPVPLRAANRILGNAIPASIAIGYLCVGFRWLIERREPSEG